MLLKLLFQSDHRLFANSPTCCPRLIYTLKKLISNMWQLLKLNQRRKKIEKLCSVFVSGWYDIKTHLVLMEQYSWINTWMYMYFLFICKGPVQFLLWVSISSSQSASSSGNPSGLPPDSFWMNMPHSFTIFPAKSYTHYKLLFNTIQKKINCISHVLRTSNQ